MASYQQGGATSKLVQGIRWVVCLGSAYNSIILSSCRIIWRSRAIHPSWTVRLRRDVSFFFRRRVHPLRFSNRRVLIMILGFIN